MNERIENMLGNHCLREQGLRHLKEKDAPGILLSIPGGSVNNLWFVLRCFNHFKEIGILEEAFFHAFSASRLNNSCVPLSMQTAAITFMNRKKLLSLGEPFGKNETYKLYRGVAGNTSQRRIRGLSWSGSLEIANWFAHRYDFLANPSVYEVTIKKEDIVWYSNNRKEDEFVVLLPENCIPQKVKIDKIKNEGLS